MYMYISLTCPAHVHVCACRVLWSCACRHVMCHITQVHKKKGQALGQEW